MVDWYRSLVAGGLLMAGAAAQSAAAQAAGQVEHVVSDGGIEAYLINEPSIPFMSLSMHFRGGAALDPADKAGLGYMVSGLLDEGAGEIDSKAFQTELEDLAIRLSFDASRDQFTGQLKTLTEHRERAFELLRLALTAPRFDAEPVDRIRNQIQAGLRRRAEDPDYIAQRTWFETAFPGHAYGRPVRGTIESVGAITTDDLRGFVAGHLTRDRLVVGVAGDVTAAELGPLLDATFGDLPATGAPVEVATAEVAGGETILIRRDVPQSQVLFGENGLARDDPDFYAAYVANHILGGGGFTSRLTDEVREKRGLAYSVYSYLYPTELAPMWMGGVGTANGAVAQSIDVIREQIARMATGDVTQAELDDARTYLTGSFPLRLTSNDRIAGILVAMQVHELGVDYLDRRNGYIEAVALDDVRRVAARLYRPDDLLVVVVGDPAGVEG